MRVSRVILTSLIFFTAVLAPAQNPGPDEGPPGITIRKYKWIQVGPGPSVDQQWKAENDSASTGGSSDDPPSVAIGNRPFFIYSLELENGGSKAIKAIRWEYIILDTKSSEELGNHDFEN